MSTLQELSRNYYELEARYAAKVAELGEDADGLEVFRDTLESIKLAKDQKAEQYAYNIRRNLENAEAMKAKAREFMQAAKHEQKRAEFMKHELLTQVKLNGGKKIQTDSYTIGRRRSEVVKIADLDKVPAEFIKTKTTTSADKNAIKKALKAGQTVEGAQLVENYSLTIK